MTYTAIVVGGGIVGASVAYHLVRAGAQTLLLDRDTPGRATDAGAGIVTAETHGSAGDAWLDFAAQAGAYYPELVAQLSMEGASDTGYAACGQLIVAVADDEIAPFTAAQNWMRQQQQRRGSPAKEDLYEVSSREAQELFPPLAETQRALYYRNAARVDGRLLAAALLQAAVARGLVAERVGVDEVVVEHDRAVGVRAGGRNYAADIVVIAGGAWSQSLGDMPGIAIPVEPVRGQIVHLGVRNDTTGNWPLITAFHGHYLVAWPGGRVAAGATYETGAGFAAHSTAAGLHEVLGEALRVAPGLRDAELREVRVGLRPLTTPDGLPMLGAAPGVPNLFVATGHSAYGLHLGPYSGKVLADLMLGASPRADLAIFDPARLAVRG